MEQLLMTQALDERDFLAKKIQDKIAKCKFVGVLEHKGDNFSTGETREQFTENVKKEVQSITDLIDRYERLERAITRSNAATVIKVFDDEMTVAEAITIKNRLSDNGLSGIATTRNFYDNLAFSSENAYKNAMSILSDINRKVDSAVDSMYYNLVGNSEATEETKNIVEEYRKANTAELVDPVGIETMITAWKETTKATLNEINVRIKISNATTTIEF